MLYRRQMLRDQRRSDDMIGPTRQLTIRQSGKTNIGIGRSAAGAEKWLVRSRAAVECPAPIESSFDDSSQSTRAIGRFPCGSIRTRAA